jgi:ABC-2 type transport system ATP-binding protein
MAILSIKDLTKRFGAVTAVDHLSLDIGAGAICGILGPNGAGKSTTIRILATLTKPTSGCAEIGGHNVMTHPVKAKEMIGVVHQSLNIDPELTPREHLTVHGMLFGMKMHAIRERREMLLDFVGLAEKKDIRAGKLSGGMKRRLTVARALMHEPAIIIINEPTVGLDAHARRRLWSLMRELRDKGHTILLTTHYIDEAEALCDQIVIIDRGRIIADGAPDELIATVGRITAETRGGEYQAFFFDTREDALAFLGGQQAAGAVREANLEDVFIKLTGRRVG